MTQRHLGLLFAASVAVLVLAIWIAHNNRPGHATNAGAPVLAGLRAELNSVTKVRITGAAGVHATLDKGASRWMVSERGYPADTGKLRKLLIDLGNLKTVEPKTRLASNYPVLGVQDVSAPGATGARVDVLAPGKTWSLIVGHTAGATGTYARVVGHKQSLLVSPQLLVDAQPAQWLDPIIVDLSSKRVREIEERPVKGGAYRIERAKASQPDFTVHGVPHGRKLLSADVADDMASALSNLTLSDVAKASAPSKGAPSDRALFRTFNGLEIEVDGYLSGASGPHDIELVARTKSKKSAAEAAQINARVHDWEYTIPGYRYSQIFRPLSGLLAPLPLRHHASHRTAHVKKAG